MLTAIGRDIHRQHKAQMQEAEKQVAIASQLTHEIRNNRTVQVLLEQMRNAIRRQRLFRADAFEKKQLQPSFSLFRRAAGVFFGRARSVLSFSACKRLTMARDFWGRQRDLPAFALFLQHGQHADSVFILVLFRAQNRRSFSGLAQRRG